MGNYLHDILGRFDEITLGEYPAQIHHDLQALKRTLHILHNLAKERYETKAHHLCRQLYTCEQSERTLVLEQINDGYKSYRLRDELSQLITCTPCESLSTFSLQIKEINSLLGAASYDDLLYIQRETIPCIEEHLHQLSKNIQILPLQSVALLKKVLLIDIASLLIQLRKMLVSSYIMYLQDYANHYPAFCVSLVYLFPQQNRGDYTHTTISATDMDDMIDFVVTNRQDNQDNLEFIEGVFSRIHTHSIIFVPHAIHADFRHITHCNFWLVNRGAMRIEHILSNTTAIVALYASIHTFLQRADQLLAPDSEIHQPDKLYHTLNAALSHIEEALDRCHHTQRSWWFIFYSKSSHIMSQWAEYLQSRREEVIHHALACLYLLSKIHSSFTDVSINTIIKLFSHINNYHTHHIISERLRNKISVGVDRCRYCLMLNLVQSMYNLLSKPTSYSTHQTWDMLASTLIYNDEIHYALIGIIDAKLLSEIRRVLIHMHIIREGNMLQSLDDVLSNFSKFIELNYPEIFSLIRHKIVITHPGSERYLICPKQDIRTKLLHLSKSMSIHTNDHSAASTIYQQQLERFDKISQLDTQLQKYLRDSASSENVKSCGFLQDCIMLSHASDDELAKYIVMRCFQAHQLFDVSKSLYNHAIRRGTQVADVINRHSEQHILKILEMSILQMHDDFSMPDIEKFISYLPSFPYSDQGTIQLRLLTNRVVFQPTWEPMEVFLIVNYAKKTTRQQYMYKALHYYLTHPNPTTSMASLIYTQHIFVLMGCDMHDCHMIHGLISSELHHLSYSLDVNTNAYEFMKLFFSNPDYIKMYDLTSLTTIYQLYLQTHVIANFLVHYRESLHTSILNKDFASCLTQLHTVDDYAKQYPAHHKVFQIFCQEVIKHIELKITDIIQCHYLCDDLCIQLQDVEDFIKQCKFEVLNIFMNRRVMWLLDNKPQISSSHHSFNVLIRSGSIVLETILSTLKIWLYLSENNAYPKQISASMIFLLTQAVEVEKNSQMIRIKNILLKLLINEGQYETEEDMAYIYEMLARLDDVISHHEGSHKFYTINILLARFISSSGTDSNVSHDQSGMLIDQSEYLPVIEHGVINQPAVALHLH